MSSRQRMPDLRFVIPPANENRWSDLLASMISTDVGPIAQLVGEAPDRVQREVVGRAASTGRRDRLDLLLSCRDVQLAAIEVKLLSDLGPRQLARYEKAFADARSFWVLHLAGLPVSVPAGSQWRCLTWEEVLEAYSHSEHAWVAETSRAWLAQLRRLGIPVEAGTRWNDLPDTAADFELALRARVAWLAQRMDEWGEIEHDLLQSTGGGNWVARLWTPTDEPGYAVTAEIQEGLTSIGWRYDPNTPYRERVVGPVVMIGLRQDDVDTSAHYRWDLLHRLFTGSIIDVDGQVVDDRRWQTTSASPRHPMDRAHWRAMVDAGAPKWLGKGYGMAEATKHHSCVFGARYEIGAASTLGEIDVELQRVQYLLRRLARVR